ncbi:hypothetical protein KABACHOK_04620 [Brevundimonas phage vB_BpoS-Kabachok]|uniref:Uncharacterized protein n=1 Tax=Brevundimonas phage vB_BpoS-Kabachok TaxID=2948600 RepID=A0A9E7SJW2_9CAUD|nr:hypothetical protein KABACHOK_04620 [Brevundimonas phage vB_BpoS-Kabachok]
MNWSSHRPFNPHIHNSSASVDKSGFLIDGPGQPGYIPNRRFGNGAAGNRASALLAGLPRVCSLRADPTGVETGRRGDPVHPPRHGISRLPQPKRPPLGPPEAVRLEVRSLRRSVSNDPVDPKASRTSHPRVREPRCRDAGLGVTASTFRYEPLHGDVKEASASPSSGKPDALVNSPAQTVTVESRREVGPEPDCREGPPRIFGCRRAFCVSA